ncbi:hypothetical protein V6N11_024766 [Hibiscus sabdariffa]|uniref:ANR family transcriptional regulator n=1 Tax=Hibiscus sabdariffa TaxID=183260 RepID=A0ABR2QNI6_9ROSI
MKAMNIGLARHDSGIRAAGLLDAAQSLACNANFGAGKWCVWLGVAREEYYEAQNYMRIQYSKKRAAWLLDAAQSLACNANFSAEEWRAWLGVARYCS